MVNPHEQTYLIIVFYRRFSCALMRQSTVWGQLIELRNDTLYKPPLDYLERSRFFYSIFEVVCTVLSGTTCWDPRKPVQRETIKNILHRFFFISSTRIHQTAKFEDDGSFSMNVTREIVKRLSWSLIRRRQIPTSPEYHLVRCTSIPYRPCSKFFFCFRFYLVGIGKGLIRDEIKWKLSRDYAFEISEQFEGHLVVEKCFHYSHQRHGKRRGQKCGHATPFVYLMGSRRHQICLFQVSFAFGI